MRGVLLTLVFVGVLGASTSLRCYTCSGGGDSHCSEPPNLTYILQKMCKPEEVCIKLYTDYHVERFCGAPVHCALMDGYPKKCITCHSDLCNSAPLPVVGLASFVSVISVALQIRAIQS